MSFTVKTKWSNRFIFIPTSCYNASLEITASIS
ncbi:hypothetical protein VCHENC02_5800A, partial [Vibrio harveyi]